MRLPIFGLENVKADGAFLVGGLVGLQFMNSSVEKISLTGENRIIGMQGLGGIVGTGFDWICGCSGRDQQQHRGTGDHMSAFSLQNCDVSGMIKGGKESVGELVGDPVNAEIADSTAFVEFQ